MSDFRALVIQTGGVKRIPDADTLLVGTGVKTASGALTINGAAGVVLQGGGVSALSINAAGTSLLVQPGATLATTGTGNINLPNNGSAVFQIEGVPVASTVTASSLGALTDGSSIALHAHAAATTSVDGFESAADKTKLDGIAAGATNTPLTSSAPANVTKATAAVGSATTAARSDHKHDVATSAVSDVGIANAEGSSTSLARADHTHNTPFSAVQTAIGAAGSSISVNSQKITNLATPTAASDAVTKAYADAVASGINPIASARAVATANVASLSGTTTIDGVSLVAPDRVLLTGQTTGTQNGVWVIAAGAWTRPVDYAAGGACSGTLLFITEGTINQATGWICTTDPPSNVIDTDASAWTKFNQIGLATVAPANVTKAAAVLGTSANAAREDHKHDITTAAPSTVGVANAEGSSTSIARADHVHDHGAQTSGTLHAVATPSVAGFISTTDKTKLDEYTTGGNSIKQTIAKKITADTTTTSSTFVTLLSQAITTVAGSVLLVFFSEINSSSSGSAVTFFRITVDATAYSSGGTRSPAVGDPQGISLIARVTGLTAGAHTVLIEWRTTGGTARIRPVTIPDGESAGVLLMESKV